MNLDWITWKTNVEELINPQDIIEEIEEEYINYNVHMNPLIYEEIKYEVLNGGLDNKSFILSDATPIHSLSIETLNKIDSIRDKFEDLKNRIALKLNNIRSLEKEKLLLEINNKLKKEQSLVNNSNTAIEKYKSMNQLEMVESLNNIINISNKKIKELTEKKEIVEKL